MEKILTWYRLLLKAQWKRLDTWLVFLGIAGLALLLGTVSLPDNSNARVLVYCSDKALASEVMDALWNRESVFTFEEAESLEDAQQQVVSGRAECAFEVQPDFKERLRELDREGLVTYYASSFSTKGEIAKETFYAALLPVISEIFLEVAAPELYEESDELLLAEWKERQKEYLEGVQIFTIEENAVSGDVAYAESEVGLTESNTQPVRGTLTFLLFLLIYFCIGETWGEKRKGFFLTLGARESLEFSAVKSIAAVTLPGMFVLLWLWRSDASRGFLRELLGLFLLTAYSILWCMLVLRLLKTRERYLAGTVAIMLLHIVICPLYVDMALYFPVIKYLRFCLPLGVYLLL
jgi:hypothetical protein